MQRARLALSISMGLMAAVNFPSMASATDVQKATDSAQTQSSDSAQNNTGTSATAKKPSAAKPEEATKLDAVQVTGFSGSLAKSVADKRNAEVISDTISSEDIGKFPEQNMAESLQRVTGVQITRSNGEGQFVSLDGLDPKFTEVLYNGRELPSATGTRSFDFTILSSEFVQELTTYKSPTANLPAGGLAGTINIGTLKPLDYGKEHFAGSADGVYDDNAKGGMDPHVSAVYTNTYLDHTLGWMVGADYDKRQLDVEEYQAFGMQPTTAPPGPVLNGATHYNLENATNLGENIGERTRDSFISALQYKPNDIFEARLDGLYSRFHNDTILPVDSLREVNVNGPVTSSVVDPAGNVVYYDGNGIDNRNNARTDDERDTLKSIGLGGTLKLQDWTLDGEASYSSSKKLYTDISLEALGRASGFYDLRTDPGGIPSIGYDRGYDPMDPNNFNAIGVNGDVDQPTSDRIRNFKFTATRDISSGWLSDLQMGVDRTDQTFATGSSVLSVPAEAVANALGLPYNANIESGSFSAAQFMRQFGGSGFLSGYSGGSTFPKTWLSADPRVLLAQLSLHDLEQLAPLTQNQAAVSSIEEKSDSAFVKLDFDSPDGRFSGNVGLRYVRTDEDATGYVPDLNTLVFSQQGAVTTALVNAYATVSNSYSKVLPSLNLRYNITDDLIARFAAAKVMQRPDLSVLAPTTIVNADVDSITKGNPNVAPYLANQFDASFEWYFNKESLLSLAFFYKDVKNFVVSTSTNETYDVTQLQSGAVVPTTFSVLQPNNGANTTLKGVEAGYQQPFTFLPGWLKGFGALANYTYIDAGELKVTDTGSPLPLPGVSKNSYNVGAYYENATYGARLLYNYRSGYVSDPLSFFGDGAFVKGYGQLDFSANYNINKSLSATFQIVNVTNAPLVTVNNAGINRGWELDGRRYQIGLHLNF
jgi:iron complex outermembrane receptor protein